VTRRAPQALMKALLERGILAQLRHSLHPIEVAPIPEAGMDEGRIVAPIVVGGQTYGYIWVIKGDEPLEEWHTLAIESAATVAALILLRQQAIIQTEARLHGNLIAQLLQGLETSLPALVAQAQHLGLDVKQPLRIVAVEGADQKQPLNPYEGWHAQQVLQGRRLPALIGQFGENTLAVVHSAQARAVAEAFLEGVPQGRAGIGPEVTSPTELRVSYRGALEALAIAASLGPNNRLVAFEELGYLHWLYQLPPEERKANPYFVRIAHLADYDRKRRTNFVQTLEVYLDEGGNALQTARRLFIHRSTLNYRLEKIRQLIGVDLRDPKVRLNLHIALRAYQLPRNGLA